jgi:hypothetical protein
VEVHLAWYSIWRRLYQAMPNKMTLSVMQDGKTAMVGEKSNAHHYKLKGGVIEDGAQHFVVFSPGGETTLLGCST